MAVVLGRGPNARVSDFTLSPDDMPSEGWDLLLNSMEPYLIKTLSNRDHALWLCRGKVVHLSDMGHLSEEEQKLEVAHAVLRHEKRYRQLQRQLEAFDRLERADVARRGRISDHVRLFVWQRDQGKCVKCGCAEQLEYDHIIPIVKGGSNTERNIQLLCEACNRGKGANI